MTSMRKAWPGALILVAALAFGCEGTGGGDGSDAGIGGNGGGGSGGEGPDGGGGNGGGGGRPCDELGADACTGRADCVLDGQQCGPADGAACTLLREDQCGAREDCAARRDVFGDFAECRGVADVPCGDLDEGRCGGREDCTWDGDRCNAAVVPCEAQPDEAACVDASCYWYADACHTDPQPNRCNQPDPAACEGQDGCVWTDQGCREEQEVRPCHELQRPACDARDDCRWSGDACEIDPETMACAELGAEACAAREDCQWDPMSDTCGDAIPGACATLDEAACGQRPDCVAIYGDPGDGCNGGGAAEAPPCDPADPDCNAQDPIPCPPDDPNCGPPPPPECDVFFTECRDRPAQTCAEVPVPACDATPGCHVEAREDPNCVPVPCDCDAMPAGEDCVCEGGCDLIEVCVDDAPGACGDLSPDQCAADPRCQLVEKEVCDQPMPADGRGFIIAPVPCEIQLFCEPAGNAEVCAQYGDAESCMMDRACQWAAIPDCGCAGGGGGEVPPGDCACPPEDPNCGCGGQAFPVDPCVGCFQCIPAEAPPPDPCEALPLEMCADVAGCGIVEEEWCGCDGDVPPGGGDPAEPCFCEIRQRCITVMPEQCEALDERLCLQRPECEWIMNGGEPMPLPEGCECPDNGDPCVCPDGRVIAPPLDGVCQPRAIEPQCWNLDEAACAEDPSCAFVQPPPFECPPCRPDGPCPECPEPVGVCQPVDVYCQNLDPAGCAADARCFADVIEVCEGGGVACPPGEACPDPLPPVCEQQPWCRAAMNACEALAEDACDQTDGCLSLRNAAGEFQGCWTAAGGCEALDPVRCAMHSACTLVDGPQGCGCWIDEAGNEVCECDVAPLMCVDNEMPPPGLECRMDADCPAGAVCMDGMCAALR